LIQCFKSKFILKEGKMFSKMRFSRVLVLLTVFVVLSAIAVSAAPECHIASVNTAASGSLVVKGGIVHDVATIVLSNPARLHGNFIFEVCGPTAATAPCAYGTGTALPLAVPSTDVTTTTTPQTIQVSSADFVTTSTTKTGWYCFTLDGFTALLGNGFSIPAGTFPHIGGVTGSTTSECFYVPDSSTAVTLSSFSAQSDALDVNNLVVPGVAAFAGLLVLAGLLGTGYVLRARS
jgi:hypothetical protein